MLHTWISHLRISGFMHRETSHCEGDRHNVLGRFVVSVKQDNTNVSHLHTWGDLLDVHLFVRQGGSI